MRKSVIDEAGGLRAFGCYLAEDFFLAKAVTDRGWRIRISHQPAWQNCGACHIPSFQKRVTRWAKLRIAMVPTTIIFEPMSECMMLGALAAWANYWLFAWDPLGIYLLHILVWFILDYILLKTVQVSEPQCEIFKIFIIYYFVYSNYRMDRCLSKSQSLFWPGFYESLLLPFYS